MCCYCWNCKETVQDLHGYNMPTHDCLAVLFVTNARNSFISQGESNGCRCCKTFSLGTGTRFAMKLYNTHKQLHITAPAQNMWFSLTQAEKNPAKANWACCAISKRSSPKNKQKCLTHIYVSLYTSQTLASRRFIPSVIVICHF